MTELPVGCVLMAAGNGARFGANKLLAAYRGVSLIRRAMDAVPQEGLAETVVVTQYDEIAAEAAEYGFACVRNRHPELGVSHTVALGTQALAAQCSGILYMVADQPLLQRRTVAALIEAFRAEPDAIHGLCAGGKRGNPCIFPAEFFPELCGLEGDRGGMQVIRRHPERLRLHEVPAQELADIDTAQALALLEQEA